MDSVKYRDRIYDVFADLGEPVDNKINRALEIGVEYLDLPVGFFTRIDEGTQEIVHSTGGHPLIQPGETCPLDKAYCRRTIQIETPLAVQDANVSSAISDAAVETFGLGAYIGARVVVENETYGTVCFADTERRKEEFSDPESYFVELIADLVGHTLERREYEHELEGREEEIKRKEEVYRAVVDSSFDLVFQIDKEGQFTYVSQTVEDLLGYGPGDYIGQPFTSMLPDQETIETAEEVYEEVMSGNTVEREYFPLEHKTGDPVVVDIRVTPLFSGEVPPEERTPEDIVGVQGMARDARDRRRRQRLIRVLNRVLRHNLRNDMNVITSYAEVLQDQIDGEEVTYARKIAETSERLMSLGETARKLEENIDESPKLEEGDIVPVVNRAANQIDERYSDASITVETPESAVAKTAPRLETAVWELVDNAARHGGENPSIEVTVSVKESHVLIRISDDGPGLPDQEREVLVSGEETPLVHGSGLGLWLVYWIVDSLDGQIEVRGDEGTSIGISLKGVGESEV